MVAPITVGFGGSVGLQGPAVSTGAAIGSNVAQHVSYERQNKNVINWLCNSWSHVFYV